MSYSPSWHSGQLVGIVAPASAPHNPDQLKRGLAAFALDGYKAHWNPDALSRCGYLSGSDTQRVLQFNQTLTHARHLFTVRGGYGSLRILDRIDYPTAKRKPGILIGYSDITALQFALFTEAGWRSISGPVIVEWDEITQEMKNEVRHLLEGRLPNPIKGLNAAREGKCTGILLGGNLSMIVRMIGSKYLPSLKGKILFIEDVNEPPYRVDGLLTQMKNAGILEGLGGLMVGSFTKADPKGASEADLMIQNTILECVEAYSWPVATGLRYGHIPARRILPIGVKASLSVDANEGRLDILEPVARS